jgi:hypothetical protein
VIIGTDIVAKTRGNKKPSETNPTDKENSANVDNQLLMVVKSGSFDKEVGPLNIEKLTLNLSEVKDLADVEKIKTYDNNITTRENELSTAKSNFENDKNPTTRKAVKSAENNLKFAQQDKELYLKTTSDKIKVVAYFTKNKGKTKVQKDFTVTANGIN